MWWNNRLDEHIKACDKRYEALDKKITDQHEENRGSIRTIIAAAWSAAGALILGLFFIIYSMLHAKGIL